MLSSFLGWLLFLEGIDDIILQSGTIADHTFSLYLYDSNRRGFIIIFARIPLWEQETLVKCPIIVDVSQIETCVQLVFFPA